MISPARVTEARELASERPVPFSVATAVELWTDDHISKRMLEAHLDPSRSAASRTGAFIEASVDWIVSRFEIGPESRVLDLGCGPGLYTNALAAKGASVTGVDVSSRSLAHARSVAAEQNLDATYVQSNYLDIDLDSTFDLIVMIFCDICALSASDRLRLLAKVRRWLSPSGAFLFDCNSLAELDARSESSADEPNLMGGFWSAEEYHGFRNSFVYADESLALDKFTIVGEADTRVFYNWAQCLQPADIEADAAAAGLDVVEVLGDVAGTEYSRESAEFATVVSHGA